MKLAFQFDSTLLGGEYGTQPKTETFRSLLAQSSWTSTTKVYFGDLLVMNDEGKMDRARRVAAEWLSTDDGQWSSVDSPRFFQLAPGNAIYAIVLESVEPTIARAVHNSLKHLPYYVGAQEVYDGNNVQLVLTSQLIAGGRIDGRNYRVFAMFDDPETDEVGEWRLEEIRAMRVFDDVTFEMTHGRFSIIDDREWPQAVQREAKARRTLIDLHSTMVERVIAEYGDAMPSFGDVLFAATQAFANAETVEQYAHVATSCRRVIDQLADQLVPAANGDPELGKMQTRDRLRKFVRESGSDEKTRGVIERELDDVFKRLSSLSALNSRLVHAEVTRDTARRCLIQTIVLLDDIRALIGKPLPMAVNPEGIQRFMRRISSDEGEE